jgi:hypothetical protein
MRLTKEELKEKYYPEWNDSKHDIVKVCYGDEPLITWDDDKYSQYKELSGTLSNIEAIPAYIYTQYDKFSIYTPLIGEIYISDNILNEVLCGNILVNHTWNISLNLMYGLVSLTITKNSGSNFVGFRTKDGICSPMLAKHTKAMSENIIYSVFNHKSLQDYGIGVQKFMEACRKVYYSYPDNYILENCFGS